MNLENTELLTAASISTFLELSNVTVGTESWACSALTVAVIQGLELINTSYDLFIELCCERTTHVLNAVFSLVLRSL